MKNTSLCSIIDCFLARRSHSNATGWWGQEDQNRLGTMEKLKTVRTKQPKTRGSIFLPGREGDFPAMHAVTSWKGGKDKLFLFFFLFSPLYQNFCFLLILQQSSRGCEIPLHLLLTASVVVFSQAKSSLPCWATQSSALR